MILDKSAKNIHSKKKKRQPLEQMVREKLDIHVLKLDLYDILHKNQLKMIKDDNVGSETNFRKHNEDIGINWVLWCGASCL
jgi:hypothetical protein